MEVPHMSQLQELKKAKKIYLFKNGAGQDMAKMMVINDRVVKDFPTLLSYATTGLKAPVAIRNLYTPQNGHRIGTLDDIQPGQVYVAAGQERFKKIKYGAPRLLPQRRGNMILRQVPARTDQAVVASARYKKPTLKPFHIHVFRNGDEKFRGVKILLTTRTLYSMDHVLELVMEKAELFTPASRLCAMDGRPVKSLSELENGKHYVAIEGNKPFKRVKYSVFDTIPETKKLGASGPIAGKTRLSTGGGYLVPHPPPNKPPAAVRKFSRHERPMGGRKDKEKREKAIEDQRADSVIGSTIVKKNRIRTKPTPLSTLSQPLHNHKAESDGLHRTNTPPQSGTSPIMTTHQSKFHASERNSNKSPTKAVEEEPTNGVFKSKTEMHNAEGVHEAQDIEVEQPIDHEQAQEVEELSQTDAATAESSNKVMSTHGTPVTTTQQQSPLKSDSGQLSPSKRSKPRSSNNSDSLEAASQGHSSPTKSNQSSRTGHVDSKRSKERTPISRTSHHEDT